MKRGLRNLILGRSARLVACRKGATAVEFAIVLPVVLTALLAVMEGGRLAYTQAAISFAAQEATRFAVVREGSVTIEEIERFAKSKLIGLNEDLAAASALSDPEFGSSKYTVNITYPFRPIAPYVGRDTIRLSASSSGFLAFAPAIPTT